MCSYSFQRNQLCKANTGFIVFCDKPPHLENFSKVKHNLLYQLLSSEFQASYSRPCCWYSFFFITAAVADNANGCNYEVFYQLNYIQFKTIETCFKVHFYQTRELNFLYFNYFETIVFLWIKSMHQLKIVIIA